MFAQTKMEKMSETVTQNQGASGSRTNVDRNNADDLAEIDLLGLMMAVFRRWKLCAAICCAVVAAGLAYCFLVTTQYQTTSRIFVDTGALKTTPKDEVQFVLSSDVLSKVFEDFKFGETKAFAQVDEPMKRFRKLYEVKEVPKTSLVELSFKDPDVKRSAAVNEATANAYIANVRERVRHVLLREQSVLQTILVQREKERNEAAAELEAFKQKHGILELGMSRSQAVDELNRVGAAAAAAAASPLMSQSGSSRITFVAQPQTGKADREKVEREREDLTKELQRLDALAPEYALVSGRYDAAQGNYQAAFNAVQSQTTALARIETDQLARVVVPASTDEDFVKKQPAKIKVMAVLILAALVLSVLVCVVLELLDRTVKNRGEVERASGLSVLGEIQKTAGADDDAMWRKVVALLGLGKGSKALVVTSPSVLATTVSAAARLAAACAENGKKVLLAEINTGKDLVNLMKNNGISGGGSVMQINSGLLSRQSVTTASGATFDVAAAVGCRKPDELKAALEELTQTYDIVLMETAPLTESADALNAASMNGVQVLVTSGLYETKRDDLVDAVAMLDRVGARTAGAVIFTR